MGVLRARGVPEKSEVLRLFVFVSLFTTGACVPCDVPMTGEVCSIHFLLHPL